MLNKKGKSHFSIKKGKALKHVFYQNIFKKNKKQYFLLDFFRGLKGSYILANVEKKGGGLFYYKSFSAFCDYNFSNNFDYLFKDLNVRFFSLFMGKKSKNTFLSVLVENKKIYSLFLKKNWLFKFFLGIKKIYMHVLGLKVFQTVDYLRTYYIFLRKNFIIKAIVFIKSYFRHKLSIKLLSYKPVWCNNLFIFFDYSKQLKLNKAFNKVLHYNEHISLKRLFLNRAFRKLNKYYRFFKIYKSKNFKKLKSFFMRLIKLFKYNDFNIVNESCAFFKKDKMVKFKNKVEAPSFLIVKKKKKLIKSIFYINIVHRLYGSYYLNYKNKSNVVLKYYFYFYNFVLKIFIKLLNNFKLIVLGKFKLNIERLIWFKIFLIFSYYRRVLIKNIRGERRYKRLYKNVKFKIAAAKHNAANIKFDYFLKKMPEMRKKRINEALDFAAKDFKLRFMYVKKIKRYKIGNYFFYFKLSKLKKMYSRLYFKLGRMRYFNRKNILKVSKLMSFIRSNKLKKKRVLKLVGLQHIVL